MSLTTGTFNTAIGAFALRNTTTAIFNTAIGVNALLTNRTGSNNTATGAGAFFNNTASNNSAHGHQTLFYNTTGDFNTANGFDALLDNTTGDDNTAEGAFALVKNTTGGHNTSTGFNSLFNNTTGSNNTALGFGAGLNATTGSNNIYIGTGMAGLAGESTACYIGSIFGQTSASGIPVFINSNNKLETVTSSKRFKEDIKPMDKASESILALKPVTFRYKEEIDALGTPQFGLVAEDVEKMNPALVVRDKERKPYSVRYDAVNAMLLNEFLKEHRRNAKQEAIITELKSGMIALAATVKEQAAQLQKVSDQLAAASPSRGEPDLSKPAPQVVLKSR